MRNTALLLLGLLLLAGAIWLGFGKARRARGALPGSPDKVRSLLGAAFRDLTFTRGDCPQFGTSPEDIWELFSTRYGPTVRALSTLQGEQRNALRAEILAFLTGYLAADGRVRWGREYLITRAIRC